MIKQFRLLKNDSRKDEQIADKLNELIKSVNNQAIKENAQPRGGKSGDIQIVEKADKTIVLRVRTEKGWHETNYLTFTEK